MNALDWLRESSQQAIRPVYTVFGDDAYLARESIQAVARAVFPEAENEGAVSRFAGPVTSLAGVPVNAAMSAAAGVVLPMPISPKPTTLPSSPAASAMPASMAAAHWDAVMAGSRKKLRVPGPCLRSSRPARGPKS